MAENCQHQKKSVEHNLKRQSWKQESRKYKDPLMNFDSEMLIQLMAMIYLLTEENKREKSKGVDGVLRKDT